MNIERYLNNIPTVDVPSGEELDHIYNLLQMPGMPLFLGLLLGAKQGELIKLANTSLSTEHGRFAASATQGRIEGIDYPRQLLLELFSTKRDPSSEGASK